MFFKYLLISSMTLTCILSSVYAQDSEVKSALTASGAGVAGTEKGPSIKIGVDVRSGDTFRISGSLGREGLDFKTVGHIDTLLQKNIPLSDDKDVILILGYTPLSIRSTSTVNVTEAFLKANIGVALKDLRTRLLYTVSPLSGIGDRSGDLGYHNAFIQGFSVEQDIGDIMKLSAQFKVGDGDKVRYTASQSKIEVPVAGKFTLYGFYEVDRLKTGTAVNSSDRSEIKSSLKTAGIGVKIGLSSVSKQ